VGEAVGVLGEQPDRVDEEVVEAPGVAARKLGVGLAPDRGDEAGSGVACRLLVVLGGHEPVLGQRDRFEHLRGGGRAAAGPCGLDRAALGV
jgi:hypothetical protein